MTDAALSTRPPITEEGRRLGFGTKTYLYVSMTIVAAIVIVPLLTTVLGGFKTMPDLRGDPFGLPREWQWQNYGGILFSQRYWLQMGNSLLIACLTVFLTLVCGAMAAFTFAHMRFFGSGFLLNYFLLGLMFPAATAILPLFIRVRDLGLLIAKPIDILSQWTPGWIRTRRGIMLDYQFRVQDEALAEDVRVHDPIHVFAPAKRWVERTACIEVAMHSNIAHDGKWDFLEPWRFNDVLPECLVHDLDYVPVDRVRARR